MPRRSSSHASFRHRVDGVHVARIGLDAFVECPIPPEWLSGVPRNESQKCDWSRKRQGSKMLRPRICTVRYAAAYLRRWDIPGNADRLEDRRLKPSAAYHHKHKNNYPQPTSGQRQRPTRSRPFGPRPLRSHRIEPFWTFWDGEAPNHTSISRNPADKSSWRAGFKGLLGAKYTKKEQRVPTCQAAARLHDFPESQRQRPQCGLICWLAEQYMPILLAD